MSSFGGLTTSQDNDFQQAREALSRFHMMTPQLNAFARAITKNKSLRVKPTSRGAYTDGKDIYLSPPFALGSRDARRHDKALCAKRDENSILKCVACNTNEEILISLLHEIAHIAYGSFAPIKEHDKLKLTQLVLDELGAEDGSTRAAKIKERLEAQENSWPAETYQAMAGRISPFLPPLVNALEDVRINHETMRSRQGTKKMFRAMFSSVMLNGFQTSDNRTITWETQPLNAQIEVGAMVKAMGFEFYHLLDPSVVEALEDKQLNELLERVPNASGADEVYYLSIKVLERFRAYGFCRAPDDPEDDDDDDEEPPPLEDPDETEPDDEDTDGDSDDQGEGSSEGEGTAGQDDQQHSGSASDDSDDDLDDDPGASGDAEGDDDPENNNYGDQDAEDGDPWSQSDDEEEETSDDGDEDAASAGEGEETGAGDDGDSKDEHDDSEEVAEIVNVWRGHGDENEPQGHDYDEEEALERAINQGQHFDTGSANVAGVRVHRADDPVMDGDLNITDIVLNGEDVQVYLASSNSDFTIKNEIDQRIVGSTYLKMRVMLDENRKSKMDRNRTSGRISTRVLGRRVETDDERLFQKRREPGKRDYHALIGFDFSGSTSDGRNIHLTKSAVLHQAEVLRKLGISFEVYGHSAWMYDMRSWGRNKRFIHDVVNVEIHNVKSTKEPWNQAAFDRLNSTMPSGGNLDGHTLEFYRKCLDKSNATDKLIIYYTDGYMPAMNYDEELELLQREIKECKKRGYTLIGVGINTDSPTRHGLPTVYVGSEGDLPSVVSHLEKHLIRR